MCVLNQFLPFMVINCDDIASALCVFVCMLDCVCRIFYVKCMRCKYAYHSEMNISYQMQFTISINRFILLLLLLCVILHEIVVNSLLMSNCSNRIEISCFAFDIRFSHECDVEYVLGHSETISQF